MDKPTLVFLNAEDAAKVADQLYNCSISLEDNSILIFQKYDADAVDTAIGLAGVPLPLIPGARCPIPFPAGERECKDPNVPQIYVRCLSSYVAGVYHGMTIDATQDADSIMDDIKWMLSYSPASTEDFPAEEWAIHSYENFDGVSLSEYESIETVAALGQAIDEHGSAFALFYRYQTYDDISEAIEEFQDRFCGVYESAQDFVETQYEESGMLQKLEAIGFHYHYIDWDAIVRDMDGGDYLFLEARHGEVYVFLNY